MKSVLYSFVPFFIIKNLIISLWLIKNNAYLTLFYNNYLTVQIHTLQSIFDNFFLLGYETKIWFF